MNISTLTKDDKKKYVLTFLNQLDKDIYKYRIQNSGIKMKIYPGTATKSVYGVKREYRLIRDKRELSFTIEVSPFMWNEGTLWVDYRYVDSKNLNTPKSKIFKGGGVEMHFDYNKFEFLTHTSVLKGYIKELENDSLSVFSIFDKLLQ